jgi:hypothetical protein
VLYWESDLVNWAELFDIWHAISGCCEHELLDVGPYCIFDARVGGQHLLLPPLPLIINDGKYLFMPTLPKLNPEVKLPFEE